MRKLQANDFEIGHLEGWRDASQMIVIAPERPTFTPNIQVNREPTPESVPEYFAAQRAELSTLPGFQLIEHGDRKLGGHSAVHHTYSWFLPEGNGLRVQQRQLAVERAGELFTITCSALERDWSEVEGSFELSLSAFAWR